MRQVPSILGGERRGGRQPVTLEDLRAFEELVRKHYPELRIAFKDESAGQRALGFLLYPFNPYYMTQYTSTFAPVVYFPSRAAYESKPRASFTLLAHEFIHLLDTRDHPVWFRVSYLFPQCLAPLGFLAYGLLAREHAWPLGVLALVLVVAFLIARLSMAAFFVTAFLGVVATAALAVWASGWASIAFLVGFLLLAPWPAPGRVYWERRGYAMSLMLYRLNFGHVPQILRESVGRAFYGPPYYYMSWGSTSTAAWIDRVVAGAETPAEGPYRLVADFLVERGLR